MSGIFRNSIISSLVAVAIYIYIYYSETIGEPNWQEEWIGLLLALFLVNLIGLALMWLNKIYNRILPWDKQITLRFSIEMISGILLSFLAASLFYYIYILSSHPISEEYPFELYRDGMLKFGILTLVLIYGYSLINFSSYSYNQYSKGPLKSLASERMQLELRFEALKSQLNPHYLFNALNTISSLIYVDTNQAESYIRQLASTYNYILETNDDQLVKLQDEIEMVKSYFYMHKIKFNESVELKIDEQLYTIEGFVPPFTLQILVENALKHSDFSENNPLIIEIFDEKGEYLIVKNNSKPKDKQKVSAKPMNDNKPSDSYNIGLSNIRNRYIYFTNKEIRVTTGDYFTVTLPFIHFPDIENKAWKKFDPMYDLKEKK